MNIWSLNAFILAACFVSKPFYYAIDEQCTNAAPFVFEKL